jgi:hypothetical protein
MVEKTHIVSSPIYAHPDRGLDRGRGSSINRFIPKNLQRILNRDKVFWLVLALVVAIVPAGQFATLALSRRRRDVWERYNVKLGAVDPDLTAA